MQDRERKNDPTDESTGPRTSGPKPPWVDVGRYSGLGMTWALATMLFLAGGWWLDGKVGTAPLFTIIGAFVGAGAGFYHFYHQIVVATEKGEDE